MDRDTVIRQFQGLVDSRARRRQYLPAILGTSNTTGSAAVSGRDGWCYARIAGDDEAVVVLNERVVARNGLAVFVAESEAIPGTYEVTGERPVYEDQTPGGNATRPHHEQHEFGNSSGADDVVYPRVRQIADCRVEATSPESLSVTIKDGLYRANGTVHYYAGGTVDLTSYTPGFGYSWVTLAINETGSIVYTTSIATLDLAVSDIPSASDAKHWELAAVRLGTSTTAITDWPDEAMIVDLRFTKVSIGAFLDLDDTPSSFSGQSGKVPAVNSTEDALEFVAAGASDFTSLTDTPSNYTGSTGKMVVVNSSGTALEFTTAGSTTFTGLSDTPANYTGSANKRVGVNSTADALEFVDNIRQITTVIGDGSNTIDTGVAGYLPIEFSGTITAWYLVADTTGSIVIDVWKDTWANFPPNSTDSIAGSEKPTLSGAQKNSDESLSTWTTSISAGDVLAFNVDSASTAAQVTLVIKATET